MTSNYIQNPLSIPKPLYTIADITVKSMGDVSNFIQKIQKRGDKIAVPKSKFEYITRLTGTNAFDEETMNQYMDEVNQVSSETQNNLPKSR